MSTLDELDAEARRTALRCLEVRPNLPEAPPTIDVTLPNGQEVTYRRVERPDDLPESWYEHEGHGIYRLSWVWLATRTGLYLRRLEPKPGRSPA